MKNTLVLLFMLTFGLAVQSQAQRQIEVKINPLALLIPEASFFPISAEVILGDSWGAELDLAVGGYNIAYLSGKHYFNPEKGGDKFFLGLFTGVAGIGDDNNFGGGLFIGKKWISSKNILLDIGIGIGRGTQDIMGYGKLHIGYRFGGKDKG